MFTFQSPMKFPVNECVMERTDFIIVLMCSQEL